MEPSNNDLTRLASEIRTARRRLEHVTVEMRRAVAGLDSILTRDGEGVWAAWPEPAGSKPALGARGKRELNGDRLGQVEQRVASPLERRSA
jgi:hypothetical protein